MNALPAPRLTDDPPAFVPRITSHGSLAAVQADWRALEPCAWTIYQTFEWCRLWSETIGAQAGVTPLILVVRDPDGAPRALLPLGVRKTSYGRIATTSRPRVYGPWCAAQRGRPASMRWH